MRRNKNMFIAIPIVLALVSLATIVGAFKFKHSAVQTKFNNAALTTVVRQDSTPDKDLSGADLLSVRQIVDGLARVHNVPVKVTMEQNGSITLVGGKPEGQPGEQSDGDVKAAVLSNYAGILGLLRSLSALPYRAEYKSLCIGSECNSGFTMTILFKGKD